MANSDLPWKVNLFISAEGFVYNIPWYYHLGFSFFVNNAFLFLQLEYISWKPEPFTEPYYFTKENSIN